MQLPRPVRMSSRLTRPMLASWVLAAGVVAEAAPRDAFDTTVHLPSRFEAEIVRAAARGAHRALHGQQCRQLVRELTHSEEPAPEYFEQLLFRSGQHLRSCSREGVLAVTSVGGRVIYVCPALATTWLRSPRL